MRKFIPFVTILCCLVACGARPAPDWTQAGFNRLESFKKYNLEGNLALADINFKKAVEEIKKSGDLDILARAYLVRMALQVAVLEKVEDREFLEIETLEPHPVNANFHAFLTGRFASVQQGLLPEQYRGVSKRLRAGQTAGLSREVAGIEDSVSRLIASGVCVMQNRYDEDLLTNAAEAASHNGWKKALLAYWEKLRSHYEARGQTDKALAIAKRIQIISK